jgi:predicted component of type VI protein secretion system
MPTSASAGASCPTPCTTSTSPIERKGNNHNAAEAALRAKVNDLSPAQLAARRAQLATKGRPAL